MKRGLGARSTQTAFQVRATFRDFLKVYVFVTGGDRNNNKEKEERRSPREVHQKDLTDKEEENVRINIAGGRIWSQNGRSSKKRLPLVKLYC